MGASTGCVRSSASVERPCADDGAPPSAGAWEDEAGFRFRKGRNPDRLAKQWRGQAKGLPALPAPWKSQGCRPTTPVRPQSIVLLPVQSRTRGSASPPRKAQGSRFRATMWSENVRGAAEKPDPLQIGGGGKPEPSECLLFLPFLIRGLVHGGEAPKGDCSWGWEWEKHGGNPRVFLDIASGANRGGEGGGGRGRAARSERSLLHQHPLYVRGSRARAAGGWSGAPSSIRGAGRGDGDHSRGRVMRPPEAS